MRKSILPAMIMILFGFLQIGFATPVNFQGLGDLSGGSFGSKASGVSADGSVVVGRGSSVSGYEAFRWTIDGGMVGLGHLAVGSLGSGATDVSADGSVVVGFSDSASGIEAFRWTSSGGMVGIGDLAGSDFSSQASGVSADGSVVVGLASPSSAAYEAFHWTSGGGIVGLGHLAGGGFGSLACGVSADGSVVVGFSDSSSGIEAFCWTSSSGMVGIGDLVGGNFFSYAYDVSADGSVVVGFSESLLGKEAFRWTIDGGSFGSYAYDVSADGLVVVGYSESPLGNEAFIWDETEGMRSLKDVLVNDLSLDLDGWTLKSALGISDDGLTIVGYGTNPEGYTEGWVATIPEPAVIEVTIDIKPGSCPNPLNVQSKGVFSVAVLGSEDFDVAGIDIASIRLAGIAPIRSSFEDVGTPLVDANECECTTAGPDGYTDLALKFKTQEIVEELGEVSDGDELVLNLTGVLYSGVPIEGADCIVVRGKFKPFNSADLNKDGVVDTVDFALLAENWLKSSVVED